MIFVSLLLSIVLIIFEISFREISVLQDISLLFIVINFLFWFKRYNIAIWCGVVSGIFIDLILQKYCGETVFVLFCPILAVSFLDNLLQTDSKLKSIFFSSLCVSISLFISEFLLNSILSDLDPEFRIIIRRSLYAIMILLLMNFIFAKLRVSDRDRLSGYE